MKMCQGCGAMLDHGLIVCGDCAQRMVLLPGTEADYEALCAKVHEAWWFEKEKQGADHPNMVPYIELSEEDKDYDRATVRAVLDALQGGKKGMTGPESEPAITLHGTLPDIATEFGAWISQIYNELPGDARADWKGIVQMIMGDGSPVWELDKPEA